MAAAGQRRDAMIPVFLDHIERLQRSEIESVAEEGRSAFLFVFYLLGEWRDDRAAVAGSSRSAACLEPSWRRFRPRLTAAREPL